MPDEVPAGAYVYGDIINQVRAIFDHLQEDVPAGRLSLEQINQLVDGLPRVDEKQLIEGGEKDSSCPICFTPYLAILSEEEMAHAMESPAHPLEHLGVTKLSQPWQCGHIFCRRDISKWITDGHDSCPLCRRLLVEGHEPTAAESAASDARAEEFTRATTAFREIQDRLLGPGGAPTEGMFGGEFHPDPPRNRDDGYDDRREFSGMYS